MEKQKQVLFVMGVSGSGKTTIGKLLAEKLQSTFFDGDDYHPKANVEKMKKGQPLNDQDREGWLQRLNELAASKQEDTGAIIACSALKSKYREQLRQGLKAIEFIYLEGSFELISKRMLERKNHFMPTSLLRSQFNALEIPEHAIRVSIDAEPPEIVDNILKELV